MKSKLDQHAVAELLGLHACRAGRFCGSGNIASHSRFSGSRWERSTIQTVIFTMSSTVAAARLHDGAHVPEHERALLIQRRGYLSRGGIEP